MTTFDALFVGAGRSVTPESAAVPNYAGWDMQVLAAGTLRGTIQRVDLTLRDRQNGTVLGTDTDMGPFLFPTKTGLANPLLDTGSQALSYYKVLGFSGTDAVLRADVVIKDQNGRDWTASREAVWTLFSAPVPRSPVGVTVKQNDPQGGCPFDPIHGYGLLIELAWDPPSDGTADDYIVAVADGAGTEFFSPFYAHTSQTSLRLVRCNMHVPPGAERARFAVSAQTFTYHTLSAWGVAHFAFQSCRDAGTPICQ